MVPSLAILIAGDEDWANGMLGVSLPGLVLGLIFGFASQFADDSPKSQSEHPK